MFCELWLDYVKGFKTISPWEFGQDEAIISEHKQIRTALIKFFNQENVSNHLKDLALLRKKADYEPFIDISPKEVDNAIGHMEKIITTLKFD